MDGPRQPEQGDNGGWVAFLDGYVSVMLSVSTNCLATYIHYIHLEGAEGSRTRPREVIRPLPGAEDENGNGNRNENVTPMVSIMLSFCFLILSIFFGW